MNSKSHGAATRVYSPEFDADFSKLPRKIQEQIEAKLGAMGMRLADYPHYRLTSSPEYRLRVGDYRVIYEFDFQRNEIYVLGVGNRNRIYKQR